MNDDKNRAVNTNLDRRPVDSEKDVSNTACCDEINVALTCDSCGTGGVTLTANDHVDRGNSTTSSDWQQISSSWILQSTPQSRFFIAKQVVVVKCQQNNLVEDQPSYCQ